MVELHIPALVQRVLFVLFQHNHNQEMQSFCVQLLRVFSCCVFGRMYIVASHIISNTGQGSTRTLLLHLPLLTIRMEGVSFDDISLQLSQLPSPQPSPPHPPPSSSSAASSSRGCTCFFFFFVVPILFPGRS